MKKITLLLLFLFSLTGWCQIGIGNGTNETQSLPFEPFYGYSYGQSIYLASEISASGTITGLQWYFSGNAGSTIPNSQGLTIYIGHSARTTFASTTDWEPLANLTQVYTGGITVNGPGWATITFDTPFVYDGTSSLVIAVDENMANYDASTDDFYNFAATNRSIFYRSDSTNPDPNAPPTGTRASFVPNVILQGISVVTPPNCTTLSSPANGAVNVMSGVITWTGATGSPTGYKLTVGTTPGGTDVLNMLDVGNVSTYNLGTLLAGTTYYVKVTPYNGNGDAVGCTETSFTTCGTITAPATENFTTYVPGCWQEADNGDLTAGPATFGASSWIADGFGNVGATGAAKYNVFTTGANDWLISTQYTIPATGYELKFDAAATQYNATTAPTTAWEADDYVEVLISTTGTTNWTVLYTYNNTNVPSNTGATNIIDLDAYAGQTVRFAYRVVEGAANDLADIDFSIDNFELRLTPSCAEPTGLAVTNLTDSSADINWTMTTGNYQYVLDQVATDPAGAGTPLAGQTFNATLLTQSTTYYFHVRTDCGGTFSIWSTVSFTTLATPPSNDNCSNAIALTAGGVFADNPAIATNQGATNSNPPAPGCANFAGGDVWYSVTIPASGNLTIETNNDTAGGSTLSDTGLAVYSGDCATLVLVECDDDDSADGNFSLISLTGRTPGEVLYVNAWEYGGGTVGTFKISAYDASLSTGSFDTAAFRAYPNPVKNVLNLSYSTEISLVEVYNMLGQKVLAKTLNVTQAQVDMSGLTTGNYIVKVTADGVTKTLKVIKQ